MMNRQVTSKAPYGYTAKVNTDFDSFIAYHVPHNVTISTRGFKVCLQLVLLSVCTESAGRLQQEDETPTECPNI